LLTFSSPGELIFEDKPLALNIQFLYVQNGGHLWLGSADCPFKAKVNITLYGLTQNPKTDPPLPNANKARFLSPLLFLATNR